jgi:hypothetical protein
VDYLSGDSDTLSEVEEALPEHVKDGLRMFRTVARKVAPGRTVAAQIRAVAKALYGAHWLIGWRRSKACCYCEAGPATVLDFKYRFETWRLSVPRYAKPLRESGQDLREAANEESAAGT